MKAPNTKLQAPEKLQTPKTPTAETAILKKEMAADVGGLQTSTL